jgi:hypothetical protein
LESDYTSNSPERDTLLPPEKPRKKKKKKEKIGTNRGIETLFRSTYRVHVEVSALADSKANFLISVNSIIMILIVSHGMSYITHKLLFIPVGIVMATSIGSMIFAVLTARPRISSKQGALSAHMQKGGSNLLFFGSFTQLTKEDFIEQLTATIRDSEVLYPAMMADIYQMGLVLQRKFNRLKIAYDFLLIGMPIGLLVFLIMQSMIVAGRLE